MKKSEKIKALISEVDKNNMAIDKYGLLTTNKVSDDDKDLLKQLVKLLEKRGE